MIQKLKSVMALSTILLILVAFMTSGPVFANAAEPPAMVIIVANAPSDLIVSVFHDADSVFVEGHKTTNAIESQIKFYGRDLPDNTAYVLEVKYGMERFEITMDKPLNSYHATYSLDLKEKMLSPGETLTRNVTLVGLRVSLTLLIEGAVFWLMGFRKRSTWVLFLVINLLTQGVLNLMLATNPVYASYVIFGLIFGEIFVFIVEWIAILSLVKEHSQAKRFVTVTLANFASLILGGYLISILPV
ncbi:MAG TPA: hypothetical protein VLS94_12070 [Fusibacter sp.]|nr:hypothetical protein [Fusibacter sp.]